MHLQGKHILSVDQFNLATLQTIFSTADKLRELAKGNQRTNLLQGAILANLFFEASTRTRMSFHSAFARLGGNICDTTGFTFSSISKGESLADTARIISSYADVIVMRHPEQGAVAEFAEYANVPVINGGDGPGEHPTQALLDSYTIFHELNRHQRQINGITIAMSGDLKNGRTVHSLAKLLCLYDNITFHFIAPNALQMPDTIVKKIIEAGHQVKSFSSPNDGFVGADVIYATRIQKERFTDNAEMDSSALFNIDKACIDQAAKSDAIILHPLPRDSRPGAFDLTTDLDNDSRLKIFQQAANGIPIRMALFVLTLGLESQINDNVFSQAPWQKTLQQP